MKAFTRHSRAGRRFGVALAALDCDVRIALTHYSPVPETLLGEPLEIYPFLGSYLLAQAIDAAPASGSRSTAMRTPDPSGGRRPAVFPSVTSPTR